MFNKSEWKNKPSIFNISDGKLTFTTEGDTDFWRNTHYQFNRMTGHSLLQHSESDAFKCRITVKMNPKNTYDQAGIFLYADEDNWIKTSVEFIPDGPSHLGAVVTSFAYSDWSTRDFPNDKVKNELTFELIYKSGDVEIYFEHDQDEREQLRIAHLHGIDQLSTIQFGPYACSPNLHNEGFDVEVLEWSVSNL